jgi:menaquinone-dependent protoporphyrinogen IX oxidase
MKGIIVFKSVYGSSRQYAVWLAEETGFTAHDAETVGNEELETAEVVVTGCGVIAYRPTLARWINRHWEVLKDKRLFAYTTSGSDKDDPRLQEGFTAAMGEMGKQFAYVPVGGRLNATNLRPIHRLMLRTGIGIRKELARRARASGGLDNVDRGDLAPLIKQIRAAV